MPTPIYIDLYINKGADFSQIIDLLDAYADVDLSGAVKSSISATTGIAFEFSEVVNEPRKAKIFISDVNTSLLSRRRGVYDIYSTDKITGEVKLQRQGTAHYTESATLHPLEPPPEGYQVQVADVVGLGTAATADVETLIDILDITYAEMLALDAYSRTRLVYSTDTNTLYTIPAGQLGSAAVPNDVKYTTLHEFDSLNLIDYLGKAVEGSTEGDSVWTVTRITIANNGSAVSETTLTPIAWTDRTNNLNY